MTCQCESPSFAQDYFNDEVALSEDDPLPIIDRKALHKPMSQNETLNLWEYIIEAYAKRRITYEDDRYAAMQGIALKFAALLADEYFAGIITSHIHRCLCWSMMDTRNEYHTGRIAKWPSWSWLSITGKKESHVRYAHKGYDFCVQEDTKFEHRPSQLALFVSATLLKITVNKNPDRLLNTDDSIPFGDEMTSWDHLSNWREKGMFRPSRRFHWDNPLRPDEHYELFCLELGFAESVLGSDTLNGPKIRSSWLLILYRLDATGQEYRRIGLLEVGYPGQAGTLIRFLGSEFVLENQVFTIL